MKSIRQFMSRGLPGILLLLSLGGVSVGVRAEAEGKAVARHDPAVCGQCGTIQSIRAREVKGQGSGLGAVAGGVAGAVVGHQFGSGDGRRAMTVVGAVGGAYAGNEVEKNVKSTTRYTIKVKMDDGEMRTFHREKRPRLSEGQRVRVDGDKLRPL